jgi:hypothetical protein
MSLVNSLGVAGAQRLPMALLIFYFIVVMSSVGNFVFYVRFKRAVYGDVMVNVYLVFTIMGAVAYFLVSGVSWLSAAKYTVQHEERVRKLGIGAFAMAVFHDVPLFTVEWVLTLCCGFHRNWFFTLVFVLQCIAFAASFLCVWLLYAYVGASYLQYAFGWPTEDQATLHAAKRRAIAEASAIKAHFTTEWHEPGTEIMSPAERPMRRDDSPRHVTPTRRTMPAPTSNTVTRSRVDIDGAVNPVV